MRTTRTTVACSILPDHVHMVIARHRFDAEQVVNLLKGAATRRLVAEGRHPFATFAAPGQRPPPVWARGQWKVFLNTLGAVRRAIEYVEKNPLREGLPRQRWSFVAPFDQWRASLRGAAIQTR